MHLIEVSGGVGNQLFQYAFARYVQSQLPTQVCLLHWTGDASPLEVEFELDKLLTIKLPVVPYDPGFYFKQFGHINLQYILFLRLLRKAKLIKKGNTLNNLLTTEVHLFNESQQQSVPKGKRNVYYHGLWQSTAIVDRVRHLLLQDLKPKTSLSPKSQKIFTQIKNTPNATSLHIRSDWTLTSSKKRYPFIKARQKTLLPGYYAQAIEQIEKRLGATTFFIFADDIEASAAYLAGISPRIPFIYVEQEDRVSWEDLYLMQHCQNFILSNSTFAWWACWFACATGPQKERLSIMPKNWMADSSAWGEKCSDRLKISANTIQL